MKPDEGFNDFAWEKRSEKMARLGRESDPIVPNRA
jgi:hypothetical protein